jgi:protocatechuate 4,5-dioxygenase, alpha chain
MSTNFLEFKAQCADIPGTTVFDAEQSRLGFQLNQFCMSLMKADNRAQFKANEEAYLAQFPMSPAQNAAVRARDYNLMISLGGNIYFLAKIGATDGHSFQKLASIMTDVPEETYRNMMIAGGRSIDGNRSKKQSEKTALNITNENKHG